MRVGGNWVYGLNHAWHHIRKRMPAEHLKQGYLRVGISIWEVVEHSWYGGVGHVVACLAYQLQALLCCYGRVGNLHYISCPPVGPALYGPLNYTTYAILLCEANLWVVKLPCEFFKQFVLGEYAEVAHGVEVSC